MTVVTPQWVVSTLCPCCFFSQMRPSNVFAANGLAMVLSERGQLEDARTVLSSLREAAPDVSCVVLNLAHAMVWYGLLPLVRLVCGRLCCVRLLTTRHFVGPSRIRPAFLLPLSTR
jgi:hypothetical protein